MSSNLAKWHGFLADPDPKRLHALLHDDVVFHSPVVHTPQRGRAITAAYLSAAQHVLNDGFTYLRTFDCGNRAVLEFQCEIDGIHINGIDMIEWDGDGLITDFKVMLRPLKAVNTVHRMMGEMLAAMKGGTP